MPLAKNHHVVEAFAPDATEEPLAHGIHERSTDSRPKAANRGACGSLKRQAARLL
jgi:hypothetical protein